MLTEELTDFTGTLPIYYSYPSTSGFNLQKQLCLQALRSPPFTCVFYLVKGCCAYTAESDWYNRPIINALHLSILSDPTSISVTLVIKVCLFSIALIFLSAAISDFAFV